MSMRVTRRRATTMVLAVVAAAGLLTTGMGAANAGPGVPAPGVTAAVAGVTVTWDAADYPVPPVGATRTYTVQVTTTGGGTTSAPVSGSPVTIRSLNPASSFTAVVHAFDDGSPVIDSAASAPVNPVLPAAPGPATAKPGNAQVTVSWTPAEGATGYTVARQTFGQPGQVTIGQTSRNRAYLVDSTATNGTVYRYVVYANASYGVPSPIGTAVSPPAVTPLVRPATVPGAPTSIGGSAGERAILLTWVAPVVKGGWPVSNYVVVEPGSNRVLPTCASATSDPCVQIPKNKSAQATSRYVLNLSADRGWRFRVRAVNAVGQSLNSALSPMLQPTTKEPPFSLGMRGATITELQNRLNWAGLTVPVTGVFDQATKKQVRHLQEKFLYDTTGVVSPSTWKLLQRITKGGAALPDSCLPTSLCISKTQKVLRYVVDGKIVLTMDARFGPESGGLATGEGLFDITWKDGCGSGANPDDYGSLMANCHVSTGYGTPMPWSMFFNGGQAVHYSYFFARDGYWGNSHGCINIRDWDGLVRLYREVSSGTPVYVYW